MIIERYYTILEGEDLWSIIVLERDPWDDKILHSSRGRVSLEYTILEGEYLWSITVLVREIYKMIIERDYIVLNGGVDNMIIAVEIYYMVLEGEINRMIIAVMERY